MHRRQPLAKLLALVIVLIAIGLPFTGPWLTLGGAAFLLLGLVLPLTRLPLGKFLLRTTFILPFAGVFAGITALTGDLERALHLALRAWLSGVAILLVIATTPLPRVLHALRNIGMPVLLVETIQFVYRYVFVAAEQVWRMRTAAASRAGQGSYRAAIGMAGVLFARSYERAERIHHAMLARGYSGDLPVRPTGKWGFADYLLVAGAAAYLFVCLLPMNNFNGSTYLGA